MLVTPCLADGQRGVSLLSGCHIVHLPPYCAGVVQYISIIISPHYEAILPKPAYENEIGL